MWEVTYLYVIYIYTWFYRRCSKNSNYSSRNKSGRYAIPITWYIFFLYYYKQHLRMKVKFQVHKAYRVNVDLPRRPIRQPWPIKFATSASYTNPDQSNSRHWQKNKNNTERRRNLDSATTSSRVKRLMGKADVWITRSNFWSECPSSERN